MHVFTRDLIDTHCAGLEWRESVGKVHTALNGIAPYLPGDWFRLYNDNASELVEEEASRRRSVESGAPRIAT